MARMSRLRPIPGLVVGALRGFAIAPLRSQILPGVYWYISGIGVGLAGNLFASMRNAERRDRFFLLASTLSFFASSICFLVTAVISEHVRQEMQAMGITETSPGIVNEFFRKRLVKVAAAWFFILAALVAAAIGGCMALSH